MRVKPLQPTEGDLCDDPRSKFAGGE